MHVISADAQTNNHMQKTFTNLETTQVHVKCAHGWKNSGRVLYLGTAKKISNLPWSG